MINTQTREQQERLRERVRALEESQSLREVDWLDQNRRQSLNSMIEIQSTANEMEVWEAFNDLIIEKAETIMYEGGIQALELLKADKKAIKVLQKNLKKEKSFGDWLEKNNPRIAKRLMKKQLIEKKRKKRSYRYNYGDCSSLSISIKNLVKLI